MNDELNRSFEPFCWRQQYGLIMDEMFPNHFEELHDIEIFGKLEGEI